MRKLIWLLVLLLIPCFVYSADIIVNGKVGKVIADKPMFISDFFKNGDLAISDSILMGRAIVDKHRKMKADSYKTVYSHEDRVASNVDRLMKMRAELKAWGFKDEGDLIQQSTETDSRLKVAEKARWK